MGWLVSGRAEADSIIVIWNFKNQEIARTKTGANGDYNVQLPKNIGNKINMKIWAMDQANNRSELLVFETPAKAAELLDPPKNIKIIDEGEKFQGYKVTGEAKRGATVIIYMKNAKEIAAATVNKAGEFSIYVVKTVGRNHELKFIASKKDEQQSEAVYAFTPKKATSTIIGNVSINTIWQGQYSITGTVTKGINKVKLTIHGKDLNTATVRNNKFTFNRKFIQTSNGSSRLLKAGNQIKISALDSKGNQVKSATTTILKNPYFIKISSLQINKEKGKVLIKGTTNKHVKKIRLVINNKPLMTDPVKNGEIQVTRNNAGKLKNGDQIRLEMVDTDKPEIETIWTISKRNWVK